ncbi:methyltransferase [Erythrobacter sp. KY5]|uniref:methyltransferase n=1 Tax=Erythrobacter sp. KY5 TaxID=2011159 RepID=UPI000DBF06F1|nr:methyltransferase [Erythrobacter sp. KY5]AWW74721.1 methyltransferase [Erythrobacter sp. KY5]
MTSPQVPRIFDRKLAAAKWARARFRQSRASGASYLYDTVADDIDDRLDFMRFKPSGAMVVGDATGTLTRALEAQGADCTTMQLGEFDEEKPSAFEAYDLILHLLGLGTVNDLPGALIHARNALREGGLFIGAFPGSGSLPALRQISLAADADRPAPRMHPLVDLRGATGLMERALFKRQVVDSYPVNVRFGSLRRMIEDLRDHGLTRSLNTPAPQLTRDWLARAEAAFDDLRDEDGKVTETFETLVLTGWR